MPTRIRVKRSTVSGITPTTGDIASGELAINLPDRKLFTSNGTAVYELGSNLTNLAVSGNVTIGSTGDIVLTPGAGIFANGSLGTAAQVLSSNGTSVYWAAPAISTNTDAQYAWTNTHSFSNTVTFSNTNTINITTRTSGGSNGATLSASGTAGMWLITNTFSTTTTGETSPRDLFFKPDGLKLYITGSTTDTIQEFTLSTAWELGTATYTANVAAGDASPEGLFFRSNGTKMYVLGSSSDTVREFDLSTAWSVNTATFVSSFSVSAQDATPTGISFSNTGNKMFIAGAGNDRIYEYDLATPWVVNTAVYNSQSFSVAAQDLTPHSLFFNSTGTRFFFNGISTDALYWYDLTTPWSVNTAVYVDSRSMGNDSRQILGIWVEPSQNKAWAADDTFDRIIQYSTNNAGLNVNSAVTHFTGFTDFANNVGITGALHVGNDITTEASLVVGSGLSVGGGVTLGTTTSAINMGSSQTTGSLIIGGATQTGSIQVGRSTANQTVSIANGATASGSTKIINIGTEGLSGSNTTINIGSALGDGTITINEPTTISTNTLTVGTAAYFVANGNLGLGVSTPGATLTVNGSIVSQTITSQAAAGEGGQISFNNPDNASQGLTIDVSTADSGRIFQTRNNSALQIGQLSGTGGVIQLHTGGSERMRIAANGNIGIGTSTPGLQLDVVGSGNQTVRARSVDTSGTTIGRVMAEWSNNTSSAGLEMRAGSGYTYLLSTGASDPLLFGVAGTERARLDTSGNFGVGGVPVARLHVFGTSSSAYTALTIGNPSGVQVNLDSNGNTEAGLRTTSNHPFAFWTNNTERMRVAANGNIGVGNTTPAHRLRVEGDISLSGGVHANGALGTAGQVLTSNGTTVFWSSAGGGSVTQVSTGNGLSGGPITTSGTVSVLANNGITANATGLYVTPGTGTVVNTTGVHVNSTYIGTLTANNSTNFDGQPASFYTNATNISTGTLNNARLPATVTITSLSANNILTQGTAEWPVINRSAGDTVTHRTAVYLSQRARGTVASPTVPIVDTILGGFEAGGWNGTAYTAGWNGGGAIFVAAEGTWTGTSNPTSLRFGTNPTGATGHVERMRIAANGNVGISTGAPGFRLDVVNNDNNNLARFYQSNTTNNTDILVNHVSSANNFLISRRNNGESWLYNSGADPVVFHTSASEQMRIAANGNIGIGTSAPANRLHVTAATDAAIRLVAQSGRADLILSATTDTVINNITNTPLVFTTNSTEQMRIAANGNVGIGTSSPGSSKLFVQGLATFGRYGDIFQGIRLNNNANSAAAETSSFIDSNNNEGTIDSNIFFTRKPDGGSYIALGTTPAGSRTVDRRVERLRLDQDGNLGVGTAGGDYGRAFRIVARHDQNGITQFGVINANTGASAVAQITKIGGTGNSFLDWALQDNAGTPIDTFGYGTGVTATRFSFGGTERVRILNAGQVQVSAGTAAAPALSTLADTNTGMFFPAADTIAFAEGGTEVVRIDSAGNVGIGTTSPSALLDVNGNVRVRGSRITQDNSGGNSFEIGPGAGTGDANQWGFFASTSRGIAFFSNAVERMRIAANGNIGIGTSGPGYKLQVDTGTSNGLDGIGLFGGATTSRSVEIRPAMGAGNNNGLVQAGDSGIIFSAGSINTGAFVIAPWANNLGGIRIVGSTGNIGIGLASPNARLESSTDIAAPFYLAPTTIAANYTIPTNYNAMTPGPVTVNSGVIVTVPSGSTWTVV